MRAFLLLLVAGSMAACSAPREGDAGRAAAVPVEPRRIITLASELTETVAALGLEDRIVATDVTSSYPGHIKELPKVGYGPDIGAEGLLSLSPDLVLAKEGQLEPAVIRQLEVAGVRLIRMQAPRSMEAAKLLVRQLADSLGRPEQAAPIVARMDGDIAAVSPLPVPPKVIFVYARGAGTLMVGGDGTPVKEMVDLAGGTYAITGFREYKPLTSEALVEANPDVVLLFNPDPAQIKGGEPLMQVPGMAATRAGQNRAFLVADPVVLAGFGPRAGLAVATLNRQLHGMVHLP